MQPSTLPIRRAYDACATPGVHVVTRAGVPVAVVTCFSDLPADERARVGEAMVFNPSHTGGELLHLVLDRDSG